MACRCARDWKGHPSFSCCVLAGNAPVRRFARAQKGLRSWLLTREGQKMGKSLGNVLDPEHLLQECGTDAVRWYLLRDIQFGEDGDFQQQRFRSGQQRFG